MILGDIFLDFSVDSQDAKGRTLLMNVSVSGKVQAVQGLMKRGADLCLMNKGGWNSLLLAALVGNP